MTSVGVSLEITEHACNQCALYFQDQKAQREHYKTEFHLYNMKRRVAGLDPIEQTVFEAYMERLAEEEAFRAPVSQAHKKSKMEKKSVSSTGGRSVVSTPVEDPMTCLFDSRKFGTVEENLEYMRKKFSFFIPSLECLVDLEGLLMVLADKICTGHVCIYCDRQFGSLEAVRGHMLDMNHTRIGTETDDLLDDIEDFFEYPQVSEETAGLIQEDGTLTVASGTKMPRELAYIYKQRHSATVAGKSGADSRLDLKGKYLQILGGETQAATLAGGTAALHSLALYQLKRMVKQTMRDKQRAFKMLMRTELKRHRTAAMQHAKGQIVELYSYGK